MIAVALQDAIGYGGAALLLAGIGTWAAMIGLRGMPEAGDLDDDR